MIAFIAGKEFLEIARDGRFRWAAGITGLLLLAALMVGYQKYGAYVDMQRRAQDQTNAQWFNQGDKNPHAGAHYGNYAFKPAGPLAFFDSGIGNYTGTAVLMEAHRQNFAIGRPATDRSAIGRFGDLSGAMILQLLMPLLIIFLGFAAFAGERESGTLRQVVSTGAGNRQLLWGKALGIAGAVLLAIVPCALVGGLALWAADLPAQGESPGWRTALLAAAYAIYAATFLFITLAVSAWAKKARTALMVLVGFWVLAAFLAPRAATEISRLAYPTPPYGVWMADLQAHRARGFDGVPPAERFEQELPALLAEYGVDSVDDLPVYLSALRLQKFEEYEYPVFDEHFGRLREAYANQQQFQDRFGLAAPTLPLRSVSMALAGTDLTQHIAFADAAEAWRRNMVKRMNNELAKTAAPANAQNSGGVRTADGSVFRIVPPFEFVPAGLGDTLVAHRGRFVALLAWLAASLALALGAVRRLSAE